MVGGRWYVGSLPAISFCLPYLPPTTYPLSFQQHSRFKRLSICVFIDIPASQGVVEGRPFVFIDIPALLLEFLRISFFHFHTGTDILSKGKY
jgi:hypothetical protein